MKRKPGDRPGWKRILAHRFIAARGSGQERAYPGVVSLYTMLHVAEPLYKPLGGQPVLLAADGFAWLQFYPSQPADAVGYVATAMLAADGTLAQWYVDICADHGLSPEGVPWHDDLYLDLISSGRGDVELIDVDDLEGALAGGAISPVQYDAAWRAAHWLAPALRHGDLPEIRALDTALAALRTLETGDAAPGFARLYRAP